MSFQRFVCNKVPQIWSWGLILSFAFDSTCALPTDMIRSGLEILGDSRFGSVFIVLRMNCKSTFYFLSWVVPSYHSRFLSFYVLKILIRDDYEPWEDICIAESETRSRSHLSLEGYRNWSEIPQMVILPDGWQLWLLDRLNYTLYLVAWSWNTLASGDRICPSLWWSSYRSNVQISLVMAIIPSSHNFFIFYVNLLPNLIEVFVLNLTMSVLLQPYCVFNCLWKKVEQRT